MDQEIQKYKILSNKINRNIRTDLLRNYINEITKNTNEETSMIQTIKRKFKIDSSKKEGKYYIVVKW